MTNEKIKKKNKKTQNCLLQNVGIWSLFLQEVLIFYRKKNELLNHSKCSRYLNVLNS